MKSALDGVTETEAHRQPPPYQSEPQEEGWPAPGTIAWQVAHLTHCKRHYTQHFGRAGRTDQEPVDSQPWKPIESFKDLLAALREAHLAQRAAIAALEPKHLEEVAGNGMTYREFLAMVIRHDTWHASQIAIARRWLSGLTD